MSRPSHRTVPLAAIVAVSVAASCGKSGGAPANPQGGAIDAGDDASAAVVSDPSQPAGSEPASVEPSPASPPDDVGNTLGWSAAPTMDGVLVQPNRDSVIVAPPDVAGAKDYRVVLVPAGVAVTTDANGGESIRGSTIVCAGYRQHAAPAGPRELLRMIEVNGLAGSARLVVEAIDQACPFPGVRGNEHHDFAPPQQDVELADRVPFAIYTEDEIVAKYGSAIVNGHGPASTLAAQADPIAPKVLARTTIKVTPLGTGAPAPASTFFDDFADSSDQPKSVRDLSGEGRAYFGHLSSNAKWNFYTYDAEKSEMYVDRGQLRMVLGDASQQVMATNYMIPKRGPAQLSNTDYLHLTYEVQSDVTGRRYWWIFLCGAAQAGQTLDAQGNLLGNIVQTASFMENDGINPSLEGWNCLQVFARDGWPVPLPPDHQNPQTEIRVMLNQPRPPDPSDGGPQNRNDVLDVDPSFMTPDLGPPSWFRQIDAKGSAVAPILDDQQLVAPRARFDVYVRRDRVILLVNGQQRLCNDFASTPLTMAEAAVGFGQVLYHSSAERVEQFVDYWPKTGKYYILENSPYLDVRTYDNVGFTEHAAPPASFDESVCFHYSP